MSDLVANHPSSGLIGAAGDQHQAVTLALAFLAGYTRHTRAAYRRDLADWWRWCAAHDLAVLEAARVHVELYARELEAAGHAPATAARRLAALAGFYQYAVAEGVLVRSPVAHVRRPKVADDTQTTGLDHDQLRAMLETARQRAAAGRGAGARDLALVTLLAHNGLRIGEALAADVEDLGTERGHRVLRVTRKGAGGPPLPSPQSQPAPWATIWPAGPPAHCSPPPPPAAWTSPPPSAWSGASPEPLAWTARTG